MASDDVAAYCDSLSRQPLFHLSLHSKELFHSNFLGWLCEAYPGATASALGPWVPQRPSATRTKVQRERAHLDLAVELPGLAPFIVEAKVFSPPDESQLERYAVGTLAGLTEPSLFLLSLAAPAWPHGTYTTANGLIWHHLSFADLRTMVASAAAELPSETPGFERLLLDEYVRLVGVLEHLAELAGRPAPDDPIEAPALVAEQLRRIRLHDAVGKLRARAAIAVARQHTTPQLPRVSIDWEANFTNGSPLMSAFVHLDNGDRIGWQYQHNQWRAAVISSQHVGRGDELRDRRAEYAAKHYGEWFEFSAIPQLIGRSVDEVSRREATGAFNHYAPDFVYRYGKLPSLTLVELLALSHHYLTEAVGRFN